MSMTNRPCRSVLYIPASKARALEKARALPVDAIIFDLEDAVAVSEKPAARGALVRALEAGGYGARLKLIRVNGLETEWGAADAAAAAGLACDGVLVPKVERASDLDRVAQITGTMPLWAMMETPRGILNAAGIAGHPLLEGMVMGTNDLSKDLHARTRPDRLPLMAGLGACVLAAKAEGRVIVDGVYNAFQDEEGLRAECVQGRDMGFDGKTLIHPSQIDAANTVFAPTRDEIALAQRQIEVFEAARAAGEGVAVLDGRIVENLHVETARRTIAMARAIMEMAG